MYKLPIIISASRMTDMPAFYPRQIIEEVEIRKAKGFKIHTIALWTKHIQSFFKEPLFSYLKDQQKIGTQLYVQLTITGIGRDIFVTGINQTKVFLEPFVPAMEETLPFIGKLVDLVQNPDRISLRVDPLVRLCDANGKIFSNYGKLAEMVNVFKAHHIRQFTFSFLEKGVYGKIDKRFLNAGIDVLPPDAVERLAFAKEAMELSAKQCVVITSCAVPGLPVSACIDGELLQQLHNEQWLVDLTQPRSRGLCGCTKSVDIGGWPPKTCASGCIYCYSRPQLIKPN